MQAGFQWLGEQRVEHAGKISVTESVKFNVPTRGSENLKQQTSQSEILSRNGGRDITGQTGIEWSEGPGIYEWVAPTPGSRAQTNIHKHKEERENKNTQEKRKCCQDLSCPSSDGHAADPVEQTECIGLS